MRTVKSRSEALGRLSHTVAVKRRVVSRQLGRLRRRRRWDWDPQEEELASYPAKALAGECWSRIVRGAGICSCILSRRWADLVVARLWRRRRVPLLRRKLSLTVRLLRSRSISLREALLGRWDSIGLGRCLVGSLLRWSTTVVLDRWRRNIATWLAVHRVVGSLLRRLLLLGCLLAVVAAVLLLAVAALPTVLIV